MKLLDVAIAGGGPAGAVAAMVLASRGLTVAVFEREPDAASHVGDCLPADFAPLLRKLNLEAKLNAGPHARVHGNRAAWGSGEVHDFDSILRKNGSGWRLDRRAFAAMLACSAVECGALWNFGAMITSCRWKHDLWVLEVDTATGRKVVNAKFVMDATGRRASIARGLGIARFRHDKQLAVVGEFQNGSMEDTFTLVETVPSGWWYSGLLGNGTLSVMFMTDSDLPEYSQARLETGWLSLLRDAPHSAARVETYGGSLNAPLRVWPAGSEQLESIAGDYWLAIGDAAAAHDPVSSYGIGSAMGSGYYAAHAAAEMLSGTREAQLAYLEVMQRSYDAYLAGCTEQYQLETRWPNAPFWQARQKVG